MKGFRLLLMRPHRLQLFTNTDTWPVRAGATTSKLSCTEIALSEAPAHEAPSCKSPMGRSAIEARTPLARGLRPMRQCVSASEGSGSNDRHAKTWLWRHNVLARLLCKACDPRRDPCIVRQPSSRMKILPRAPGWRTNTMRLHNNRMARGGKTIEEQLAWLDR